MPLFPNAFALMQTLPGVGELSAAAILVEMGTDTAVRGLALCCAFDTAPQT
jgi:transposase